MENFANQRRPLDDLIELGPALDPPGFLAPKFERGRRDEVLFHNGTNLEVAKNVLFASSSQGDGIERAYWPLPQKSPIQTIMGHVEICIVLKSSSGNSMRDDDDDDDDDSDESDEEDIVLSLTDEYVAVKVNYCDRMERLKNSHAEDPLKEISAMQHIGNDHPNVMGCIEVLYDGAGNTLNIVMRYCGNGDLFQLLADHKKRNPAHPGLNEQHARYWFRQLIHGMAYMHKRGVCHRDLSPENIMMDGSGALVIDMGMCLRMPYSCNRADDDNNDDTQVPCQESTPGAKRRMIRPQGTCGKLPYMSPEIFTNRTDFDGVSVDLWTSGTILFCMLTGNRSYTRAHPSDPQFYWMTHGLPMLLKDWNCQISMEALDMMQRLLCIDPRQRLSIDEVLSHPWLQTPDPNYDDEHYYTLDDSFLNDDDSLMDDEEDYLEDTAE